MRRLPVFALLVVGLSLPVYAQRGGGGGRGGFSGGSAEFHGGSAGSASRGFGSAGGGFRTGPVDGGVRVGSGVATGTALAGARPMVSTGARTVGYGSQGGRRGGYESNRYRRPYVSPYRYGYPFGYPAIGFLDPGFLGFGDDAGLYGGVAAGPNYAPGYGGPGSGQPGQAGPEQAGSGQAPSPEAYAAARAAYAGPQGGGQRVGGEPRSEDEVTLVFRDGRAPEQIHNYMLTRTTLYVEDGRGREVPLDEIDLQATERLNGDVGVEFRPPGAGR